MPRGEMCSTCYVERLAMMQASPYSIYDDYYERQVQYIYTKCGLKGNTTVPNSLMPKLEDNSLDCGTDKWYTTSTGETCDSIGVKRGLSSASLFIVNQYGLPNCSADAMIKPGTKLCMPAKCDRVHQLRTKEDCHLLESNATNKLLEGDIQLYNMWVGYNYINLQEFTAVYRNIICFGPEFEQNNTSSNSTDTPTPQPFNPYTYNKITPPKGAKVPQGIMEYCGRWYVAGKEDLCAHIYAVSSIDINLLFMVNTGLGTDAAACLAKLMAGNAYYVGPNHN